jgi:hypothetical protein
MREGVLRASFDAVAAKDTAVWDYLDCVFIEGDCFGRADLDAVRTTPASSVAYGNILKLLCYGHSVVAFKRRVE